MTLDLSGRKLGGYTLVERLGAGSAGQVYQARDHRLDRAVAIKVLHPALAADPDRLRRFEGEALAASALAHPNIIHIYDFGKQDGTPFIVMELVEGQTLRGHLLSGPPPLRQLVDWSLQLAEGLAKAHEGDIVHRDLKLENVLISRDGYLKIVDFGLAKLLRTSERGELAQTAQGMVLGTAAYMSPEQASGMTVDFHSDQFSFGSIVYELACGEPAFSGDHFAATMASVFRCRPTPLEARAPGLPRPLLGIVDRCLEKDPADRYATTVELVADLRRLRDQVVSGSAAPTEGWALATGPATGAGPRRHGRWIAGALIAVALAIGAGWLIGSGTPSEPPPRQLRLLVSARIPDGRARDPALSPDGTTFAYVGERDGQADLFVGRVSGGTHVRLTEDAARESDPMFAPDGETVVFTRYRTGAESDICTMPTLGGPINTAVGGAAMGAIAPNGRQLAFIRTRQDGAAVLAVSGLDGSGERELLRSDGSYPFLYQPAWSPDSTEIALRRSTGGVAGEIWLVPLGGGEARRLHDERVDVFSHDPVFTPDGRAVVVSSNRAGAVNLWRLPVDGGAPEALTSGTGPDELPSIATTGAIAFANTSWRYSLRLHDLAGGEATALLSHHAYVWAPHFVADGRAIVYSRAETNGQWHLWRTDRAGTVNEPLPDDPRGALYPRRFPGGDVLYNTWRQPRRLVRSGSSGPLHTLSETDVSEGYGDPSPDGKWIAFVRQDAGVERVFLMPATGGPAERLIGQPSTLPRWSPDGASIAFSGDRSVHGGIFVARADGSDVRRLTDTGGWPVWWPDGGRIGFLARAADGNQEVRIVSLEGGTVVTLDSVHFDGTNHPFDIAPDGQTLVTTNSEPLIDEIWLLEPAG